MAPQEAPGALARAHQRPAHERRPRQVEAAARSARTSAAKRPSRSAGSIPRQSSSTIAGSTRRWTAWRGRGRSLPSPTPWNEVRSTGVRADDPAPGLPEGGEVEIPLERGAELLDVRPRARRVETVEEEPLLERERADRRPRDRTAIAPERHDPGRTENRLAPARESPGTCDAASRRRRPSRGPRRRLGHGRRAPGDGRGSARRGARPSPLANRLAPWPKLTWRRPAATKAPTASGWLRRARGLCDGPHRLAGRGERRAAGEGGVELAQVVEADRGGRPVAEGRRRRVRRSGSAAGRSRGRAPARRRAGGGRRRGWPPGAGRRRATRSTG